MPTNMTADLRSHAIGQRTREMSDDVDINSLDPSGQSLLDAQQLAAERVQAVDREWARLRKVDQVARELMLAKPEDRERIMEDLDEALWPEDEE